MKFDKQKVMKVLPFIILGYFFNKVSQAFTSAAGTELGDKIMNGMDGLGEVFLNPLPSFNPIDLLIGVAGGVIVKLVIYVKGKNAKKYRKGCEYGSARWGNAEDIKPYMADKFEDNVILTETERLTMDGRPKLAVKLLNIGYLIEKGKLNIDGTVKIVEEVAVILENRCLILVLCKLIVYVEELNCLGIEIIVHLADTVLEHLLERD